MDDWSFIDAATLENTSFASGGGTADRHGSFFAFHNQTYFACNDRSHGGGSGYRNTIVNYVHYAANGSIAPLRIDEVGVGAFDVAASPRVEAENYFSASGAAAREAARPPWASGGRGARVQRGPQRAPGATLRLVGAGDAVFEVAADGAEIGTCSVSAPCVRSGRRRGRAAVRGRDAGRASGSRRGVRSSVSAPSDTARRGAASDRASAAASSAP
ncbi:hypothetical protein JL722_10972 [Aureococcus anophagefferens]|nr:hypothetical protein JL722_10972 [Aureococcus anophagefferens]